MFLFYFCSIIVRLKRLSSSSIIQRFYWDWIEEIIDIDTGLQVGPNLTANNKCCLIFNYHICASMIAACSWLIALYFYLWHMPDDATEGRGRTQRSRQQPSINLHAPVTSLIFAYLPIVKMYNVQPRKNVACVCSVQSIEPHNIGMHSGPEPETFGFPRSE